MSAYVATITKQSAVIAGAFLAAGVLVALVYWLWQYGQLQHALTLNMIPPALPSPSA